jgi:uncharacterized lipoprotein
MIKLFSKIIITIIAITSISACSNSFKKKVGITPIMPDEYQSVKNKPLEVPPHYTSKSKK